MDEKKINHEITTGELLHIHEALCLMMDEIEAINEGGCDYVFTTGVEESITESLEIIEALVPGRVDV